jgi:hypothetical protein
LNPVAAKVDAVTTTGAAGVTATDSVTIIGRVSENVVE